MNTTNAVTIVGGGLAGLTCAHGLFQAGQPFRLLEAGPRVGGRVLTDRVEGFLLDRGFQVFLTAYPEASSYLDYSKLNLCCFEPGALVRYAGEFHRVSDPWRRPQHLLATAFSSAGSLADKLRIAALRRKTTRGDLESIYKIPEQPTIEYLMKWGFSAAIIDRFFKPFLGGVFLDAELQTSSRMCEFVFRMFALGEATLPAEGMESIPRQIAAELPAECITTDTRVDAVDGRRVVLESGEVISAPAIVIATEAPMASKLLNKPYPRSGRQVRCLYFAANEPPLSEPILVLNGEGIGPINNLCVPSQVAHGYAPTGQSLISVTVLDTRADDTDLLSEVTEQAKSWFGPTVNSWRHLRTYSIDYALPDQSPPALDPVVKPAMAGTGIAVCGDYCDTSSINGAIASGRRAACEVLKTVERTRT